jgi:hypothetical protein
MDNCFLGEEPQNKFLFVCINIIELFIQTNKLIDFFFFFFFAIFSNVAYIYYLSPNSMQVVLC